MPTTVNGIGTHYYGRKNRTVRTAPCRSCGRVASLESYDTRLWFVIVFIPIIPLGRKRVIDSCPICTRHFVASADAYEQARQLQVSAAQDQFRRDPSPPAALQVHATLLGFHEAEQAERFRQVVRDRFPADAELMAGLAAQLQQAGSYQEAGELYDLAHRLQPELPEARAAIALRKMAEGQLDEARRLLDFLEVPGAGQHYPIGPLDALSTYYQRAGRHDEALELAAHVLREVPEAGQQHKFRAFVARSEKALGRYESILPPREHTVRGLFRGEGHIYSNRIRWAILGTLAVALLAGGLAVNNEYIRQHRTLQVINACGAPVQVRVDDQPPQTVADTGRIVLAEGRHRIRLGGAVEETHDVDIQANYFDRWLQKPAWTLVPGGEAPIIKHVVTYSKDPVPPAFELLLGQPLVALPQVDYLFEEPPQNMNLRSRNAQVIKIWLERFAGSDTQAFEFGVHNDRERALTFAESRLRRRPEDNELLQAYLSSFQLGHMERPESFLETGLERRPVVVQWHRLYQTLAEAAGHDAALVARYDGYLRADPRNAALIYLRGRIEEDWDRQTEAIRRSIDADPRLPWPWASRATRDAAAARWTECLKNLNAARERKIDEKTIYDLSVSARIGAGEARFLADESRTRLAGNPMDLNALVALLEATAVLGPPADIERELTTWQNRLPMEARGLAGTSFRAFGLYETGRLAECVEHCRHSTGVDLQTFRLHSLLALKRTKEAIDDPSLAKVFEDPWDVLAVSLAWHLQGKDPEAAIWLERGLARLDKMGPDTRRVTAILRSKEPPKLQEIERIILGVRRQAVVCALLAWRFPAMRKDYLVAAAKYNVRRLPPYQLVKLATESQDKTKPPKTAKR